MANNTPPKDKNGEPICVGTTCLWENGYGPPDAPKIVTVKGMGKSHCGIVVRMPSGEQREVDANDLVCWLRARK